MTSSGGPLGPLGDILRHLVESTSELLDLFGLSHCLNSGRVATIGSSEQPLGHDNNTVSNNSQYSVLRANHHQKGLLWMALSGLRLFLSAPVVTVTGEQGILGHQVSKDGDLATAASFHSLRCHKLPVCWVTTASLSRMDLLGVLRSEANPPAFPRPSAMWGVTAGKWL